MQRLSTDSVSTIQFVMANANALAWRDAIVMDLDDEGVVIAFLDGDVELLRVVGAVADLATGEPVAYHPVAEILTTGTAWVTARR